MHTSLFKAQVAVIIACFLSTASAIGRQIEGSHQAVAPSDASQAVIEQAITAVIGTSSLPASSRELFARHLRQRGEAVPAADKLNYWGELRAKPELKNTPIYDPNSTQSQAVLKIIRPVLMLYERDWDIAVIQQDAPFSGVFRQCIFIVSTGLLQLITDEELRGFAAHELAHECFIEELREADRIGCARTHQVVELKSDLVAALVLLLVTDDPLSLAKGVQRVEDYYLKHDPSVLRDGTHPPADWRQRSLKLFMKKINKKRDWV